MAFLDRIFGVSTRAINKLSDEVQTINSLGAKYQALSEQQIKDQVKSWREELAGKEYPEQQEILKKIMPEVFAAVREITGRTTAKPHFDVQLLGGMTLHKGQIAEMRTGEGKTQTAALPIVLNALTGRGVHLVTVNDYLARWHASLMGPIYHGLGLSVASIQHEKSFLYDPGYNPEAEEIQRLEAETQGLVLDVKHMRGISRREAYAADITYGTNNEFGFDYLRDNMVGDLAQMVQRELHYAIVDEVDSILIDEARTPLIISAPDADPTDKYYRFAKVAQKLSKDEDYTVDEKRRAVSLNDQGIAKLEKELGVDNVYEQSGIQEVHHFTRALEAKELYKLDHQYVVRDGEIIIVDEFTGRMMFGRRYSDGLHQAIEAKEGVKIQQESKTLATITFQNYFRMYKKLAGMTGTALTESEEFYKIYGLEVVAIPTHRPMIRKDHADVVYKSEKGKFEAIVKEVAERHKRGQPMLIGTVSIQKNEMLAEHLRKAGLQFELLNAKNHEREANIIAQAGRLGAITVATNIAGRGVDILLGGNPVDEQEAKLVRDAGGLHILGTERHESRRIDNQLRGRSGRQGDPGSSQFFVSVEDDLMRLFGGSRLQSIMERLGIREDEPIEHSLVSKSIEQAQKKIEGLNFDTRKHVLEYDDIMNKQREVIYKRRRQWLSADADLKDEILGYVEKELQGIVTAHFAAADAGDNVGPDDLINAAKMILNLQSKDEQQIRELYTQAGDSEFAITDSLLGLAHAHYDQREKDVVGMTSVASGQQDDHSLFRQLERLVCLQSLDQVWMEHLDNMEHLRDSVGLRGYGQRDPLVEYKREGFEIFQRALAEIERGIVYAIFNVGVQVQQPAQAQTVIQRAAQNATMSGGGAGVGAVSSADNSLAASSQSTPMSNAASGEFAGVGRNDPCPCGSGKKFKKCGLLNTVEHQQNMAKRV